MAGIKVEIELSTLGLEQDEESGEFYPSEDLADRIIAGVVANLTTTATSTGRKSFEQRVSDTVDSVVKEFLGDFLKGEIQRRDRFDGQPIGPPTTIKEMAMAAVEKYLVAPKSDRGSYSNNTQNLGEMVDNAVKDVLSKELKPTIDEAKKTIKDTVLTRVVAEVTQALMPPVGK